MKVFVSSTVYDLLDIRSELDALLKSLGVSPVLSDNKLSGFDSTPDSNSIETCLLNVANSDIVIVVLDKRYGPKLGKCGFDDVSATHLEYRKARQLKKPIYFYVRDRLEAEFNIWKKNSQKVDLKCSWVQEKDFGLFELLEEHRSLDSEKSGSNWVTAFTTSMDLKDAVRKQFEPITMPITLMAAIEANRFPLFVRNLDVVADNLLGVSSIKATAKFKNIGRVPAFNVRTIILPDEPQNPASDREEVEEIVGPDQELQLTVICNVLTNTSGKAEMRLSFDTAIGVTVRERHSVEFHRMGNTLISGGTLLERTYHMGPRPDVQIHSE